MFILCFEPTLRFRSFLCLLGMFICYYELYMISFCFFIFSTFWYFSLLI
ncbi:hypothetical protein Lalb_Chr09g0330581 [Lupinus albus]|uniref:Uncharacterized protein n=1 Tax=Lupinus albus TaxID=3870 RepID=A0A6A4Q0Z2_LUPAL|nr:hypothetical protein Lalb_Chr09g0330581 [Lupinus albus]